MHKVRLKNQPPYSNEIRMSAADYKLINVLMGIIQEASRMVINGQNTSENCFCKSKLTYENCHGKELEQFK